jgi:hypothetical protein
MLAFLRERWTAEMNQHMLSASKSFEKWALDPIRTQQERDGWVADILRDLFGNPFRPVETRVWLQATLAWNDGTVPRIAQAIYDEAGTGILDTNGLSILADAVRESCHAVGVPEPDELLRHLEGWSRCDLCSDELITRACPKCHCTGWLRSTASHVRGCWAVDMLRKRRVIPKPRIPAS